jgi:hypothetical protein
MTTGRINQVTIVSQRVAYQVPRGALERFVTEWRSLKSAPDAAPAAWAVGAASGNPPSLSQLPRASVHRTKASKGQCGLGAPVGGLSALLQPLRCP